MPAPACPRDKKTRYKASFCKQAVNSPHRVYCHNCPIYGRKEDRNNDNK